MPHIFADRVVDTTSTTGTGALSLNAPSLNGYENIRDVCANGDTIYLSIAHRTLGEWEVGKYTFGSGTNVVTRTQILSSSNADNAVNFSSGTKDIVAGLPADLIGDLASVSNFEKTDVASASTCDIGAATTSVVRITGTTTVTSLGTVANTRKWVYFADSLTLTHNATSLILPGAANITTAAGDTALFVSDASGNWRCWAYQWASGLPATGLANDAVTYAKLQNISATSRVLGRKTAGAGDTEECTLSEVLDFIGSAAQGDILYRGASSWARLPAGTSGHFLQTQGQGANLQWTAATINNTRLAKTAAYTVTNADHGKTIALGGSAFYTLTFSAASGYDAAFAALIVNEDSGRGKTIACAGLANFILWPGQTALIYNQSNAWKVYRQNRWKLPTGTLNAYCDFTNGNDNNDGLATGSGNAFKTVNGALTRLLNDWDWDGTASGQTQVALNMADNTTDTGGIHWSPHSSMIGGQGGAAITVKGGANSIVSATGTDGANVLFGAVLTLRDLTLRSNVNGLTAQWGGKVYLNNVTFGGGGVTPAGAHISLASGGQVELASGITIAGDAAYCITNSGGYFRTVGFGITFSANSAFSGSFLLATDPSATSFQSTTISLGAFSVTGKRFDLLRGASVISGTGIGNLTYLPGSTAGSIGPNCSYDSLFGVERMHGASMVMINGTLTATVASNALTIAIKTQAGADPSTSDPVYVIFRNATIATGDYTVITLNSATSFVVSSGSTLGAANSVSFRLWIVGFNDAGTFRLGVINSRVGAGSPTRIVGLDETNVASSTAEGGAGGADTAGIFYTGTAATSDAFRILGYMDWAGGLATAGTWSAGPTLIQLFGPGVALPGQIIQTKYFTTGTASTTTSSTLSASTITDTITTKSRANLVKIDVDSTYSCLAEATTCQAILRRGTSTNIGIAFSLDFNAGSSQTGSTHLHALDAPDSASAVTYGPYKASSDNTNTVGFPAGSFTTPIGSMILQEIMG